MAHDEVLSPWWAGRDVPRFRVLSLHVYIIILSLFLMLPVFPFAVPIVLHHIMTLLFPWQERTQAKSALFCGRLLSSLVQ